MLGWSTFVATTESPTSQSVTVSGNSVSGSSGMVGKNYSQVFVPNSRLVAFSETARLIWSDAPSGKSALISTVILREACGSVATKTTEIHAALASRGSALLNWRPFRPWIGSRLRPSGNSRVHIQPGAAAWSTSTGAALQDVPDHCPRHLNDNLPRPSLVGVDSVLALSLGRLW